MRQVNRWFKDHYGVPVRVIRWEPETQRVIYLREGYEHECFSPLRRFSSLIQGSRSVAEH
ncbi:DUF4222 domain-containing protein (plasmid) [Escherichia coli]|uniref:DUF4222 domain-containing protein n=1 Tax=Escherichia coli TaxID=562 RepID=UPI001CBF28D5|nr:DUF4222 domain-containing protein [Escherichia coli]UAO82522.1 DUF4222 domain-containing protein [Escherichia coli]